MSLKLSIIDDCSIKFILDEKFQNKQLIMEKRGEVDGALATRAREFIYYFYIFIFNSQIRSIESGRLA